MSDHFKEILGDIIDKLKEDRPEHALPYGTWVKHYKDPSLWGVVTEAHDVTNENLAGEKTCSYMVYWLNNGKSSGKKSKMFKTTIENDFSLIVQFDEDGEPFLFEDV